jgi:prepilin-type N-terminal cleavage/methylation domain-containing protein
VNRRFLNARCVASESDRPTLTLRPAFTILELVLALAVIAAVAAIAWPMMIRFSGEQTLRQNVEAVRARLARTRLTAIEAGLVYQFRYEPNGRRCLVLPFERPLAQGDAASSPATTSTYPAYELQLEDGLQFLQAPPGPPLLTAAPATLERLSEDTLMAFGVPTSLAQVGWASPILFAPDGTAQDASLYVADAGGRYQLVSVRGLTATASVGPIEREDRR